MDQTQDRRRGHFHRGRRGPDRRGVDRRAPAQPQPGQARDQIDVEQIMREIRARIAERQGVELSPQQIDELAARRLEYILDPRAMKPEFLDTLRRTADEAVERQEKRLPAEPVYVFEDTTLYDSHRAILRWIRRLLNPLLKLFFNPNPLIRALHLQAKLNVETLQRDAERDRRQAEWNALHYRIVQRLVTEVSRLSLEVQALATRIDSLGARVDFADRRVRAIEGTVHQLRPGGRPQDMPAPVRPAEAGAPAEGAPATPESGQVEGGRRRRRRRRGRRGGALVSTEGAPAAGLPAPEPEVVGAEPEGGELEAGEPESVELDATEEPEAPAPAETPALGSYPSSEAPAPEPPPPSAPVEERMPAESPASPDQAEDEEPDRLE